MSKPTRLFFVADLHGSAICFHKFVNAARVYRADVLLVGGDIAAKTMTPVFQETGGWTATVEGETRRAHSSEELERLEARLRDSATVPYRTTRSDWLTLIGNRAEADRVFLELELDELRRWLAWAKQRMAGGGSRLLLGLGNDDLTPMEEVIAADDFAELTDREILRLDDAHELLTLPYSNPTPWKTHRELTEEQIARWIDRAASELGSIHRAVFNLHVPPHNTPLDLAPRLDSNFTKVMTPGGEPDLIHVGSTGVRSALEHHQPLLGLHGHIHESKGSVEIGATFAVNPGSAYTEGTLLGVVVDLERDRLRATMMTSG
jgi:uncharacterized protein